MSLISNPASVDFSAFDASDDDARVMYGLPRYVHFCKKCVISNQRPNSAVEYQHTKASKKATIAFDEEGICDACRFAEQKHGAINWKDREDQLAVLCDKFRSKSGYDCLLPGSGGKDSFYASHMLKTRFGMHPLTVTWAPHVYTEWGWKNFQSWLHAGFDNYLMTPNGRVHRLLTRLAVDNLFHPFQAFMFGQKSLAPKMALLHDIPLVVYGENEAEYGNPIGDTSSAQRDWSYFTSANKAEIYLGGTSVQSLYDDFGLEEQDLLPYLPADPACNPYLGFAVMLAAGLDGIKNRIEAGEPVNENIFEMSEREKKRRKIEQLPANLSDALDICRQTLRRCSASRSRCITWATTSSGIPRAVTTMRWSTAASRRRRSARPAPTANTTASTTASTISITTRPSPSLASAAQPMTRRRRFAHKTSRAMKVWRWCGAMTESSPSGLPRKSSVT